jgi:adenylate cyclase
MPPALRHKLQVVATITLFLVAVAVLAAIVLDAPLDTAAVIGSVAGFSIAAVEEFYVQGRGGAWFRRIRPVFAIPLYALAVCAIFLVVQHLAFTVTGRSEALKAAHERYHLSIPILFVSSSGAILALRVVGFIGARNLFNLLIGRYMRPIRERKVLLFLDLKGSTAAVEALGALRAKAYIGKFLFDVSRPVTNHGGDIYLYTGDGLIAIWDWDAALANSSIVAAVDAIHAAIERERSFYEREFDRVPEFRIGVHGGDVVISEQGDTRRAIGVYGDAINIAARMEQTAKELGVDCVFSAEVAGALPHEPPGLEPRGEVVVKGISEPVAIASYDRSDQGRSPA